MSRRPGLICKLDMEKAYDRVDLNFPLYLLRRMGFGVKWRNWIMECLKSNSLSILINGSPKGFFSAKSGLRQGDPLSTFLFVIAEAPANVRLIKGFCPSTDAQEITHLQYADDTILFCDAIEDQLHNIKAILLSYEVVSGLKEFNFFKSELVGIKLNENHSLAELLGCKAGVLPSTYLGLPLCSGVASKSLWTPVLERMAKKPSLWKTKYLSFGGRITLTKAALSNLPIYFMSLFKYPVKGIKRIEKLQRDFLWNGNHK
eukprot:TRINITY_DN29385_c0_g1_i1.p1 TRINITY_DN29385_c0_g1~~TRINITY_DN29385_c0_g1_i1.p1  ORF type:complete len:259 (+),score=21.37 TRINITY_DN29385_c0_g1_i1:957-1733(+)